MSQNPGMRKHLKSKNQYFKGLDQAPLRSSPIKVYIKGLAACCQPSSQLIAPTSSAPAPGMPCTSPLNGEDWGSVCIPGRPKTSVLDSLAAFCLVLFNKTVL